jgi:hypothetical protein
MPPAGTSGSGMDGTTLRGCCSAEVGARPSRHHRPRASPADQAPRAKVVRPVGAPPSPVGAWPAPRGWADGDGITTLAEACAGAQAGQDGVPVACPIRQSSGVSLGYSGTGRQPRFLAGSEIGYLIHTEVRDIGGGRIDVAAFFERFTLVCELKREYSDISVEGQRRHLLQAATYQGSDVQLGFLLVLDLRERTGPPPHLRANVHVVVIGDDALGGPRYVVMLAIPGNRTSPSAVG